MDAFEKAKREWEKKWERERKRELRDDLRHAKEMERLQRSIDRASSKQSSTIAYIEKKQTAYETEIDLDINEDRQVNDVCRDFRKAFHSELCFYNGRNISYLFIPLKDIKSGKSTQRRLHIAGRDSVDIFEKVMKACGYRVVVKFDEEGPRNKKNLAGFQYDGKGQLAVPKESKSVPKNTPSSRNTASSSTKSVSAKKPAVASKKSVTYKSAATNKTAAAALKRKVTSKKVTAIKATTAKNTAKKKY